MGEPGTNGNGHKPGLNGNAAHTQCARCGAIAVEKIAVGNSNAGPLLICVPSVGGCGRTTAEQPGSVPNSELEYLPCQACGEQSMSPMVSYARYICGKCSSKFNDQGYPEEHVLRDDLPANDVGNGRRFIRLHGLRIRHVSMSSKWLQYVGGRWEDDLTQGVSHLAKEVEHEIHKLAFREDQEDEKKKIIKIALQAGSEAGIRRLLKCAESDPDVAMRIEDFDKHPFLINCKNGIVDLHTGRFSDHDPDLYLTKQVPHAYNPDATCPQWEGFLRRIMAGNQEMVDYLQRVLGYALVGDNRHQAFFLFWGGGANGKSTMINTVCEVLGNKEGIGYSSHADPNTFMEERYESRKPRPDLARLRGSRFVVSVEPRDDCKLDPGIIKRVTGGEPITCRDLYQSDFQYEPQFKVYLCANNKPGVNGADYAMIRRLRFIPFTVTIPEAERVENYHQVLLAEAEGIFAWLVQGALEVLKPGGLRDPQIIKDATEEYRVEMDDLEPFINDCCDVTGLAGQSTLNGDNANEPASDSMKHLFKVYAAWCEFNGNRPMSKRKFADRLRQKGFRSRNGTGNQIEFQGLKVNASGISYYETDYVHRSSSGTMGYPNL